MASSVEELRVALEREADELAQRREELETELAEVERQLEARRNAVAHLTVIRPLVAAVPRPRREPKSAPPAAAPDPAPAPEAAAETEPTTPAPRRRKAAPRAKAAAPAPAGPRRKPARAPKAGPPVPAAERRVRTHLRDEIAALLSASEQPMNVRRLTEALGEEPTKSRLESVRTSAEGLVKAGRAGKAGRGLFTAAG
ncbi:hypothetical protein [Embleya hyalina]|uniref:Uncharacterized protein n=1 Tax=Embleya hyalina TaxID=516124 RepID=A0A401YD87_9ACTN|nr:hypothetical protein [Embleya hyalina]GCD92532.1 hypothetical protein EHYA_00170 [Embleya hyalina]